jgi:hypothetical protein
VTYFVLDGSVAERFGQSLLEKIPGPAYTHSEREAFPSAEPNPTAFQLIEYSQLASREEFPAGRYVFLGFGWPPLTRRAFAIAAPKFGIRPLLSRAAQHGLKSPVASRPASKSTPPSQAIRSFPAYSVRVTRPAYWSPRHWSR